MSKFENYHNAVLFLESLFNIPKAEYMDARIHTPLYLKRSQILINKLNINLNQFKIIHIAGTSGKGSTVAMTHQVLYKAGKKVGSFYSPHPTTSIERIKVNNKYISPNDFAKLMDKIKSKVKEMYLDPKIGMPSYFEIFFALALLYFEQQKCEYLIIETGCGGEFDATNIIKNPKITAITNVGLDHTHILGNTLEKIAKTKGGIIKKGSTFYTTEKRKTLLKIFQNICHKKKAKFIPLIPNKNPLINNTLLVTQICQKLDVKQDITKALKNFSLPCRFETIQKNPRVVLNGAHNFDKIKSAVDNLKTLEFNNLYLILTLNENKDIRRIINYLKKALKTKTHIYLTRHLISNRTCADLKLMYNLFPSKANFKKHIFLDPHQALKEAIKKTKHNDLILITGSFYLAGELRKNWIPEEQILKNNC